MVKIHSIIYVVARYANFCAANLGLKHFRTPDKQFHFIHCRLIASGIKDFRKTMTDVERCLAPGGIICFIDVDFDMYSNDRFLYRHFASEEEPTGSWFQRIVFGKRALQNMNSSKRSVQKCVVKL
jgi:hypothetical protein